LEIWFHRIEGRIYISGLPGKRGWYANLLAHPTFVFRLRESLQADLQAHAYPVADPAERRRVLDTLLHGINREGDLADWVERSPLVEVRFFDAEHRRDN
jgi:hypothetical protein